jgi:curved DNA-binding protein CbpA
MSLYDILGVRHDADSAAIKSAFFEKSKQLHPDVNPASEAEEAFRTLAAAYEVLSNADSRKKYDEEMLTQHRKIESWVRPDGPGPAQPFGRRDYGNMLFSVLKAVPVSGILLDCA